MSTKYPKEAVLEAAREAYRSSMAGDDDAYVERKSALFVDRCLKYDRDPEACFISKEAIDEIAFAALDSHCASKLFSALG